MLLKSKVAIELDPTIVGTAAAPQTVFSELPLLLDDDGVAVILNRFNPDESFIQIYNKEKKLQYRHHIKAELMNFEKLANVGTINRHEIFYLLPSSNEWGILNVKTFTERRGKFEFVCPRAFHSKVIFFPESKMICIYETGDFELKTGRLTFMSYPSDPPGSDKTPWVIPIDDVTNNIFTPLNNSNRLAVYVNKIEAKIRWTVYDLDLSSATVHEINKPENNGDYSLRHVAELKEGVFLLSIQASKPEYLYLVYDQNNPTQGLVPFKTKLNEKIFELVSLGPWIYAFEYNVDDKGVNQMAPLRIISKQTQQQVFQDECYIGPYVEYYAGTTNDQYLMKVRVDHHVPTNKDQPLEMELIRSTSQKELYVFIMKQVSKQAMTVDMIQFVLDAFEDD